MGEDTNEVDERKLAAIPVLITAGIIVVALGFYIYLVNYNPGSDSQNTQTTSELSPNNPAAPDLPLEELVIIDLADRLTLLVEERSKIAIVSKEPTTWPDGCLGLAREDELCSQAVVEGYRIVAEYDSQEFVYRSDQDGATLLLE